MRTHLLFAVVLVAVAQVSLAACHGASTHAAGDGNPEATDAEAVPGIDATMADGEARDAGDPRLVRDAMQAAADSGRVSVTGHHHQSKRSGRYVQPAFTRAAIASMRRDPSFDGSFRGVVHAQPLYVPDGVFGKGTFYLATESNDVLALDELTGSLVWQRSLGPPADFETVACAAAFTPIGITGTPAIDAVTRTLYVDSVIGVGAAGSRSTSTHLIHALSLDDGTERAGWPVDPKGLVSNGHRFDPTVQHQRGALLLASGMLYVPYGSLGDCGDYHGWLVAISVTDPTQVSAYSTPGAGSGMWAPNGVAADKGNIFVATGNSKDPQGSWAGGEAVLRFSAGVPLPATPDDYFAPANWHDLDIDDLDLGGSGVLLLDMPNATPSALAIAMGKDGNVYLLDQHHLGGLGSGIVAKEHVAAGELVSAPASYVAKSGRYVVADIQNGGTGIGCPPGQQGDLIGLLISDGSPPTIKTAWCAQNSGHGSPIVTTVDGVAEPIVWITADDSQRLHGFDGETGQLLFYGGVDDFQKITGAHRFNTVIAVHGRIVVAGDNRLYSFKP